MSKRLNAISPLLVLAAAAALAAFTACDAPPDGGFGGDGIIGEGEGEGEGEIPPAPTDPGATEEPDPQGPAAGQLTAAEWRDLDDWEFWLSLYDEADTLSEVEAGPLYPWRDTWALHLADRFSVRAVADGAAAADATVTLYNGDGALLFEARTDNHGRAELFAPAVATDVVASYSIEVARGEVAVMLDEVAPTLAGLPLFADVSGTPEPAGAVDLMFVVDTTGSMADELSFLQAELGNVIERVEDNVARDFDLRLSVNFYRDYGDAYVLKSNPFSADVDAALTALDGERARGGGDWPEAVEEALEDAVYGHSWSTDARTRLLFLVLDAPPHHDANRMTLLRETVREAARLGVRIIPIGASGVDRGTESLLRQMDVLTGSTYVFLTDDSGVGNDHLEPITGPVQVELLNDLLVRLIQDAIE